MHGRHVTQARQMLRCLLEGRLVCAPLDDEDGRGYAFTATKCTLAETQDHLNKGGDGGLGRRLRGPFRGLGGARCSMPGSHPGADDG